MVTHLSRVNFPLVDAAGVFTEREQKMKQKSEEEWDEDTLWSDCLSGGFPFKSTSATEGCGAGEWRAMRYQFRKLHIGEVVEASTAAVTAEIEHVWGPGSVYV